MSGSESRGLPPQIIRGEQNPRTFGWSWCCCSSVVQFVLIAATGSFNFGYNLAALNTSKSFIILDFDFCKDDEGIKSISCPTATTYGAIMNTMVFVGAVVGCGVAGKCAEIGRRAALMIMHTVFILGCLMSIASEGFFSLMFARFVIGVGVGLSTVCAPLMISEMTPKQRRGFFGVFHQLFITFGIFLATLFGLAFGDAPFDHRVVDVITPFQQAWWRVMLGFPLFICVPTLFLLMLVYRSETPHVLVDRGREEQAESLLREVYGKSDVSEEISEIIGAVEERRHLKSESLSVWTAILDKVYRPVIIIACILSIFQQLSGINVLMANSNKLYTATGISNSTITKITVGLTTFNLVMTLPPIFFVDKLGRRFLMIIGTSGQTICLFAAFISNLVDYKSSFVKWMSVGATFGYVIFFAIAYGPVLWLYLHEIFPVEIKEGAASLASALNWLATIAMVLPSEFLLTENPTVIFGIFAATSAMAFIFVFIFMKETKGLSIDESPYFVGKKRHDIMKSFTNQNMDNDKFGGGVGTAVASSREKSYGEVDGALSA